MLTSTARASAFLAFLFSNLVFHVQRDKREDFMELSPEMFKRFFPLPVTVITTVDSDGVANAAPYSCVMPILRPLPLIALASALPRDTLRNIRDTREFVINVMGKPGFREAMKCAKNYPPGVNELAAEGVATIPARKVAPPRITTAIGWIEAQLEKEVTTDKYALIVGHVVCSEINDSYLQGEKLSELPMTLLTPYFRTAGDIYMTRDEIGVDESSMR
jgi:flavin reductase (DIM6/NTAB) family NADH-FMN oxidoreductase RutF